MSTRLYVITEETRRKMSQSHKGKKLTLEHRHSIGESLKGRPCSDSTKQKISEAMRGTRNPFYRKKLSEEHRRRMSESRKSGEFHYSWRGGKVKCICQECGERFEVFPYIIKQGYGKFCSRSCVMINQRKHGQFCQTPNKSESKLINLFKENSLPFKYVGNGEVFLGNRNPDFINTNGKKQVIELLGTYWHPLFDGANRLEHYKQYGYECLTIWEDELKDLSKVAEKVRRFTYVR